MAGIILFCIPFTIPRLFGLGIYEVASESMEPEYHKGSLIYVKGCDADDVTEHDVITFTLGSDTDYVMTHRVIRVEKEERFFYTKGDANEVEDAEPVSFDRVIGRPVLCIPYLGRIATFVDSTQGKLSIVAVFVLTFIIWRIADKQNKKQQERHSEGE